MSRAKAKRFHYRMHAQILRGLARWQARKSRGNMNEEDGEVWALYLSSSKMI